MRILNLAAAALMALGLSACVMPGSEISYMLGQYGSFPRDRVTIDHFVVCMHHGCSTEVETGFSEAEWQEIRDIFARPPEVGEDGTPFGERVQIAFALARIEQIVATHVPTGNDVGGSFSGFGRTNQLDCVDEMVNTATYLTLMYNDGLMQHHRPGRRVTEALSPRGVWPHTVSTVRAIEEDRLYVIDTWIKNNGELPYVMAYDDWGRGVNHRDLITGEELTGMVF